LQQESTTHSDRGYPLPTQFQRGADRLLAEGKAVADVVKMLDATKAERGAPEFIRFDNGPEFIAAAQDWCRFSEAGAVYIEPGSPWDNPFVESFIDKARDELFAREVFHSVFEARVIYSDRSDVYNRRRPHNSISYLAPAALP